MRSGTPRPRQDHVSAGAGRGDRPAHRGHATTARRRPVSGGQGSGSPRCGERAAELGGSLPRLARTRRAAAGWPPRCRWRAPHDAERHDAHPSRASPTTIRWSATASSALLASVPSITSSGWPATAGRPCSAAVTLRPDVLVMDIQMPELGGVAATREIARAAPDVAVLMLTMFDDDDSVFAAMRAGARGYVLKGAQQDEIIRAIQAVAAGEAIFGPASPGGCCALVAAPPAIQRAVPRADQPGAQVLDLIAAGARNAEIARPHVDRAQDRGQPRLSHLRQAPGGRPGRGHHPWPGTPDSAGTSAPEISGRCRARISSWPSHGRTSAVCGWSRIRPCRPAAGRTARRTVRSGAGRSGT